MNWKGVIAEWGEYLPEVCRERPITLFEGNTPLIPAAELSRRLGIAVWLKFEGMNPTGSFKDRGMVVAMSAALAQGATTCICASTGNTAASAAAYAARAGMHCFVVVPKGKVALGKLAGATIHGAQVIEVDDNFDRALTMVRELAARRPVALVNSVNPYRIEGQKTAAFEVVEALKKRAPDYLVLPVGNAGNITAYWKGFREYRDAQQVTELPRMLGIQAAGAAPFLAGKPIENPQTVATAIRIGSPASWDGAVQAVKESQGAFYGVSDEESLAAHQFLSVKEGIFAEPASAAPVAWLLSAASREVFSGGETVVCVLTGHGLKDPETALRNSQQEVIRIGADVEALEALVAKTESVSA
ncbi:MAG: threonine synthase [Candidatus Xenobia bacterium]